MSERRNGTPIDAAVIVVPDILGRGTIRLPAPSGPLCRCGHHRDNGGHCGHEGEGECATDGCGCVEFIARRT